MARVLFLQLVTPERTRAVREVSELHDLVTDKETLRHVLDELVQSRLLVLNTGGGGGGATVELVHESLIGAWLTLRRWLEESHEDSMFLEQLAPPLVSGSERRRTRDCSGGGEMAEELFRFRRRYQGELSEAVQAFADAVQAQLHRRARLKQLLTVSAIGFLLALLAAAAVALVVIVGPGASGRAQRAGRPRRSRGGPGATARRRGERAGAPARKRPNARLLRPRWRRPTPPLTGRRTSSPSATPSSRSPSSTPTARDSSLSRPRRTPRQRPSSHAPPRRAPWSSLKREQERAERLRMQLGSPVVEVLK